MPGLGTVINVLAIVAGGLLGLLFRKSLCERIQNTLMTGCGVSVLFIGLAGTMEKMLSVTENGLAVYGVMMLVVSIALGGLVGAALDLDGKTERLGVWLRDKTGSGNDVGFVDGFVSASLTVCIGAMAVVGAIQDGLYCDRSILITKSVLDCIIVMIMTSSQGKGCIFSALPVGVFQGVFTALSRLIAPALTDSASANLSLVGSVLIFCVGVNLIWGPKIKTANLLPALIFAVLYAFLPAV